MARGLIEVTRNTPPLVQLYCAFLVFNMLITQWLQEQHIANPLKPFFWVVLMQSLHKAAFHAEALRAGFNAVPVQTLEGAASLSFSRRTASGESSCRLRSGPPCHRSSTTWSNW